jgi:cellulose synthase/poly-beta-1,6-N-acetylglucosamine synthase-like glycosyltransferase
VLDGIFLIDDGSHPAIQCDDWMQGRVKQLRSENNRGRGASRAQAMRESNGEFVVCCDATAKLDVDFVENAIKHFDDPKVAAVYGRFAQAPPKDAVQRWRGIHLFKERAQPNHPVDTNSFSTHGALVRRSAVMAVGNFDETLRHSEDADLGERLRVAGFRIIYDPTLKVTSLLVNNMSEVLERYWRWYAGADEQITWNGYLRNVVYAMKGMVKDDLRDGDPARAFISFVCPHYQFWRSWWRKR